MKKLIIFLVSMLLLTSCIDWYAITEKRNACEIIWWKYSKDIHCCYERNNWIIVKDCEMKSLQEKAFIFNNF